MSLDHLDTLAEQLPELFAPRDLQPSWDDEFIIVSVDDPEVSNNSQSPTLDQGEDPDFDGFGENLIEPGAPLPDFPASLVQIFGGSHGGALVTYRDRSKMPPPDCLAFYLPFHYYHPVWWGVYLLWEGVLWLAGDIVRRSGGLVPRRRAVQAARLFLYYHEAFHHKTECFATRLELTHRQPLYKKGFEELYASTLGKVSCLEEGLANASALTDTCRRFRDPNIARALEGYVLDSPPGYDQGVNLREDFQSARCEFAEQNQRICLPRLPHKDPDVWRSAPHMFDGLANIKSRVNYVIPRGSRLAGRLPFRPLLPPSKLVKKLKEVVGLEFVRNGGSHDIYRTRSGRTIPIPRHPGDLGRGLIRKILREAGLEMGLEEFLQK